MRLTPEQKAARKLGIGSSEIAEVLGIAPWQGASPLRLYAEKTGLLDDEDDDEETIEQAVGHALEQVLADLYCRKTGASFLPGGTVQHREHPWAFATLDAKIIGAPRGLEVKVVGIGMIKGWDPLVEDGVPHYVRVQTAWQMGCADLEEMDVTSLLGGTSFRIFNVKRDRDLEEMIFAAGAEFWRRVTAREPPPLDGSDACRAYLAKAYPPPPEDVEGEADEEIEGYGRGVILAKVHAKENEATAKTLSASIMKHMGERGLTVLRAESWRATWKQGKKSRPFILKAIGPSWAPGVADAGAEEGGPF